LKKFLLALLFVLGTVAYPVFLPSAHAEDEFTVIEEQWLHDIINQWIANGMDLGGDGSGDITGVTAGAGISGGAASGAATITWDPSTFVVSVTLWDGTQASRTLTYNIDGTDPVWTISSSSVDLTTGTLKVGGVTVPTEAGNIATATALANNPANCAGGSFAAGVDASGVSEGCAALPTTITGTAGEISASSPTGAVTLSLPAAVNLSTHTLQVPNSDTLPGSCSAGEVYLDNNADTGQRWYACESGFFVQQGGSGGGGGSGDVTAVGDCTTGACFAVGGSGTTQTWRNATSGTITVATVTGALGTQTLSLPASTGTLAITSGNVATATALAGNGLDCSAGSAPVGVDAGGNVEGCVDVALQSELDTHAALSGTSAHSATTTNTASRIVTRDGSGNFAAGTITATLTGNASTSTALAANPTNCSAGQFPLGVDASGVAESCTDAATQTELNTHSALTGSSAHSAASANTASQIVTRDGSGNFSAGTITANLTGNVTGTVTGNASTASALAANPADCSGNIPRGIAASGAAEGCADVDLTTEVTGVLPIANGGTAGATAAAARTALAVPSVTQGQNGDLIFILDASVGGNDTYTGCSVVPITELKAGTVIWFKPLTVNTGAATLNPCSLGVTTISTSSGATLANGALAANAYYPLTYDGTLLRMQQDLSVALSGHTTNTVAKATSASTIGDSSIVDDGTTVTIGDCATNCLTEDRSAITGSKTRTYLNVTGNEAVSTGTLTSGNLAAFDASSRIVDGGAKFYATSVYQSAASTINNDTFTAILFNTENFDVPTWHSVGSDTSRITFDATRTCTATGNVTFDGASGVGDRGVYLRLGGATYLAGEQLPATATALSNTVLSVTMIHQFTSTQYLELVVYQNSGGTLDVLAGPTLAVFCH
jgi:hypothetical protein